jgi:hypothetical protein
MVRTQIQLTEDQAGDEEDGTLMLLVRNRFGGHKETGCGFSDRLWMEFNGSARHHRPAI